MPGPVRETELAMAMGAWRVSSAAPDSDLAGLVQEYWEVEGTLNAFRETLLPNGFVEVMVNLGPPHQVIDDAGSTVWDRAWFSGLQERALVIESLHGTHLVSARLHPLGASELLGQAVAGAANSIVDLETLVGPAAGELRERLLAASSVGGRFALLEQFLRERRASGHSPLHFVRDAAASIERAHGNLRVAMLHEELGISRKHLAVSFTRTVGLSAKTYAMIQRFVWTLQRLRESTVVDWTQLAAEAGYSDQSHLVREFRRIGAATPSDYLRRWSPDGTALVYELE